MLKSVMIEIDQIYVPAKWRNTLDEAKVQEIAESMIECTAAKGVAVVLEATHTCMTCRGIKKSGSVMVTSSVRGLCRSDARTRSEVMTLLHKK